MVAELAETSEATPEVEKIWVTWVRSFHEVSTDLSWKHKTLRVGWVCDVFAKEIPPRLICAAQVYCIFIVWSRCEQLQVAAYEMGPLGSGDFIGGSLQGEATTTQPHMRPAVGDMS